MIRWRGEGESDGISLTAAMSVSSKTLSVVIDFENDSADSPALADSITSSSLARSSDTFCEVCYIFKPSKDFIQFSSCGHSFCVECITRVFETSIMESRVDLQCLNCESEITQAEIKQVVDLEHFEKYLEFTIRKYLATQMNVSYCLSPNCPFACINTLPSTGNLERSHFVCQREECGAEHCNGCKRAWHPGKTCREFAGECREESGGISEELKASLGTKNCPSCAAIIQKTSDDGSCNQVICTVCKTSFCWLCGKPVTEMHYMR